jgi:hypothetical protein
MGRLVLHSCGAAGRRLASLRPFRIGYSRSAICVHPCSSAVCLSFIRVNWRPFAVAIRAAPGRLFRKVWFQIVRMTFVLAGLALLYWLFVPVGSKLDLLVRFIAPMLAPLVTTLTTGWLLAGRLGK